MAARRPPADEPQQPVPKVTAADVERVLARDYAAADLDEARRIVGGIDSGSAANTARVRLAALKLADRDLARLRHWAREAAMDYRDVLSPAEYPRCGREGEPLWEMSPEKRREVFDEDWRQYQAWLGRGATGADSAGPARDGGTRRRRLLIWLAALIVLGGAAVFAVTTGDDRPLLHFWVRDGDDPPRPYDVPDGREIGGFTVGPEVDVGSGMAVLSVSHASEGDPLRRLLIAVGMRKLRDSFALAMSVARSPSVAGWREYLVLTPDPACIDASMVAGPELVGDWEAESEQSPPDVPRFDIAERGSRRWRLHGDGCAELVIEDGESRHEVPHDVPFPQWGVVGDVLVMKFAEVSTVVDPWILSADGRSARDGRGFLMRKLR